MERSGRGPSKRAKNPTSEARAYATKSKGLLVGYSQGENLQFSARLFPETASLMYVTSWVSLFGWCPALRTLWFGTGSEIQILPSTDVSVSYRPFFACPKIHRRQKLWIQQSSKINKAGFRKKPRDAFACCSFECTG